jgi:hypothetical protein
MTLGNSRADRSRPWTPAERATLHARSLAGAAPGEIAVEPNMTAKTVSAQIERLGLEAKPETETCEPRRRWSADALAALREGYLSGLPIAVIAERLKERPKVVARKAQTLGLHALISPEALSLREAARQVQVRQGFQARRAVQTAASQARDAQLRHLLIVERVSYAAAGEALGCSKTACQRAAKRLGLDLERDQLIEQERREIIRLQAVELARRHAARRAEEATSAPARVSDADLIAAAVAAGKVTIVPAAHAVGITAWERATGYTAWPQRTAIPTIASRRRTV